MKRDLILFTKSTLLLAVLLFILDRGIGWWLGQVYYKQTHGDNYTTIHLLKKDTDDILIMGGSRASHHFNAEYIEKATGMTCFNGGRDEMTVLYSSTLLPIVFEKRPPKILILEVLPTELWVDEKPNTVFQRTGGVLLPYIYKYPSVKPTVAKAGKYELLLTQLSHIYPYNSTVGTSIQNAYTNMGHVSVKGYEPVYGKINAATYVKPIWGDFAAGNRPVDSVYEASLKKNIELAKQNNTRAIIVFSPFYFPIDFYQSDSYKTIVKLAQVHGCELYDFSHDQPFLKNPALFYDDVHLNDSGATLFSKKIVDIISQQPGKEVAYK